MGISETTGFAGNEVKWTDYYMSVHFLFEPDKQLTSDLAVGGAVGRVGTDCCRQSKRKAEPVRRRPFSVY